MSVDPYICESLIDLKQKQAQILQTVQQEGYALIRGLFDRKRIRQSLTTLYNHVNQPENHLATQGVTPQKIRENTSKWSIGGHSPSQEGISRFMLIQYNPLFQVDMLGLHGAFQQLIQVRDSLANRATLTDEQLLPTHFNACRVQIYPAGGGFMSGHVDSRAVINLADATQQENSQYIQLVLLLTEKGSDYQHGGAFVEKSGIKIDSETRSLSGDVLVYDGSTYHGVDDIDAHMPINLQDLKGRAVALATIYQVLDNKEK